MRGSKFQLDAESFVVDEVSTSRSVVYKEVIGYDIDGGVVYDNVQRPRRQNGSGFVISYTEKVCDFLAKVPTGSVVRVFMYIAHHQGYGNDGMFGYRCSHKHLEQALRLDRTTVWDALKFLKDKSLVVENRINGCTEFMVNPEYITIGADKSARVREWTRRRGGNAIVDVRPEIRRNPVPVVRRSAVVECEMN